MSGCIIIYRVAGLSCPEAGGCKSAILRGFPNVFSLFGPCKVGEISFRYSWTTGMKKKIRNLVLKKGQISGFAQIDIFLISNFFLLFVHNFLQNHPNVKSWVCFEKFRKFAARWAQEFSKLKENCLRKLILKLATPKTKKSENMSI